MNETKEKPMRIALKELKSKLAPEDYTKVLEVAFQNACLDIVIMSLPEKLRKTAQIDKGYAEAKECDAVMLVVSYITQALGI